MDTQTIVNVRKDFPFLKPPQRYVSSIYLDSAATAQKPQQVIDCIAHWYAYQTAPVHRSVYRASELATQRYEDARAQLAHFIGAQPGEIIFTSGATDSINLVATSWARDVLCSGDEIIVSQLEHHANFIVWQQCALATGARLQVIPITADGQIDMVAYRRLLSQKTKLVAITHMSNVLGTLVDVAAMARAAHTVGARILVDAAQSIPHFPINVKELGADFVAFSGHKMLGPTGVGVVYIARHLHDTIQPYRYGGGMVHATCLEQSTWAPFPYRCEAGTPPIAQVIGLAEAARYLMQLGWFDQLREYEGALIAHLIDELSTCERVQFLGPVNQLKESGHVTSFVIEGIHPHDVAAFLDQQEVAVAVRAGQHCAQPLHAVLNIPASVRLSVYLYTTHDEIQIAVDHIRRLCSCL